MNKPRCGANKTGGEGTCTLPAGWQTDHPGVGNCKWHGGATTNGKKAARKETARLEVERLSIPVDTTPEDALLSEVRHVAGDVAFLRQQVSDLEDDLTQHVDTQGGGGYDAPSVWWDLYLAAHDRLVKVAASAIRAGVEERKVRIAEREMDAIAQAIDATLRELGVEVTPEVGRTLGRHLRAV